MSDYMLAPGARLEIGPHGTPYETLGATGACCSSCAKGGMGDLSIMGTSVSVGTVIGVGVAGVAAWWFFFKGRSRRRPFAGSASQRLRHRRQRARGQALRNRY